MKKSRYILLSAGIAVVVLILGLALWIRNAGQADVPESDGSLQKVLASGRFILGFDVNFPPMSFVDERGKFTGFDIDMLQEVCSRLGVELVRRPINWDAKEEELNGGMIDAISGMLVTPGRAKRMNMLEPYIKESLIFVVVGNSSAKWRLQDLKGKKIGVQAGTRAQEVLSALDIYKDITVVPFDDNIAVLQQLRDGNLDVGLVDSVAAYYFISLNNERYFVLRENLGEGKFAIGFRKRDKELRDKVQEILSEMKTDGTLGKISQKWFGIDITIVK